MNLQERTVPRILLIFIRFLLLSELGEQGQFTDKVLTAFEEVITIPKPKLPTLAQPKGESSARKMIIREMDHPMQILLFAGQILDQDKSGPIDFVVNPLSGALEIGYAIKSIYDMLEFRKVEDILLVKYSSYEEGDIVQSSLEPFMPFQLQSDLDRINEKRILIIDDNAFSGETLMDLREMCFHYTTRVGIAAIEKRMDIDRESIIKYEDLDIKPISKLRYIDRVINTILNNNLHGLIK